MEFILGLVGILIGVFMIMKTESMLRGFGRLKFFEEHLGTEGGSRLGYKLIGFVVIFIGTLLLTGMFEPFIAWLFEPLTQYMKPQQPKSF